MTPFVSLIARYLASPAAAAVAVLAWGAAAAAVEYVDPVAYVRLRSPGHTGVVQALAFSPDGAELYSAGNDKTVRVWRRPDEAGDDWSPATAMRWEVGYGVPGRIYALDADSATGSVALGGRGGRGLSGEIIWYDPRKPKAYRSWRFPRDNAPPSTPQHEQVVRSLAFSPDGAWFASADLDGQVLLWRGAERQPRGELLPPIRRVNPRDTRLWEPTGWEPRWRPIAWADAKTLVFPRLTAQDLHDTPGGPVPLWRLFSHDPVTGATAEVGDGSVVYPGFVMAIAASSDGRRIAAAGVNRAYLYTRDQSGRFVASPIEPRIEPGSVIRTLAFTADGRRLVIGREAPDGGLAEVINLDAGVPYKERVSWRTSAPVEACAASHAEESIAFSAGNDVFTVALGAGGRAVPTRLGGVPPVDRVGFLSNDGGADGRLVVQSAAATRVVDPQSDITVRSLREDEGERLAAADRPTRGYSFDPDRLIVRRRGRDLRPLPINAAIDGGVRDGAWCFVPGAKGEPDAIAVGTETSGAVFVFNLTNARTAPKLLRKFVGHEGAVTSLAAREDGSMLASGADDGTAALWSLEGVRGPAADQLSTVWGVQLKPAASGGSLVVELATQGPFFNRGVRVGDRIVGISWRENGPLIETTDHNSIVARLSAILPDQETTAPLLEIEPADAKQNGVGTFGLSFAPIWSPVLSLFGAGEAWAAWTPTGHYDASIGGDRLIGWQFNGAAGETPSFATAQQHHRKFRRPDLIRKLLVGDDPAETAAVEQVLQKQTIDNKRLPEVRVTGQDVQDDGALKVSVEVEAPAGESVDEVALIDRDGRKLDRVEGPFQPGQKIDMEIEPVDGEEQVVTARVYGTSGTADSEDPVRYKPAPPIAEELNRRPAAKKVIYLLSIGVADYEERVDVGPLQYADSDARQIASAFRDHLAYDEIVVRVLTKRGDTTGERIREELRWLSRAADGNDTIGLFFAGHSRADDDDVRLLSSDGDVEGLASAELVSQCFDASIGRKLLILDSCNSGRFREAIRRRARESDDADVGVSLFASCAEDEQAREDHESEAGVFTWMVVRGLRGAASRRDSSVVSDTDLAGYLRQDGEAAERFRLSMQEPVLYIPFAFERKSDLRMTRLGP